MSHSADHREDRELHDRLLAGDRQPEAALYRRHLESVRRVCQAVLGDADLAEDVAQDVFIEFFARPERADLDRSPLPAYLAMMGRRRAVDLVRSRESSRRREQRAFETRVTRLDQPAESVESVEAVPVRLDVWRAVSKLPRSQQVMVRRAFLADQTYREAAAAIGVAEGTAKSRMRSALTRLRAEPDLANAA